MSGNKEKYKSFCEQRQSEVPLFQQYWWMETVCKGKQWDVALAYDGDQLLGAMPYLFGRKLGITYILQPQLTPFSGPFYCYPDGMPPAKKLEFEKTVARSLIAQIESLKPAFILQRFSPVVTNWLPFYWAGYQQTTRYTYRIADITDPQRVFEGFISDKRQQKIRRYQQSTNVRFDMAPAEFAAFHNEYWNSRGKRDLLSVSLIADVCQTAIERGNGVIASLYDEERHLLSARFAVYDDRCAYSLMSAQNKSLHKTGHTEVLIWELIKYLSDKTVSYDFEGSMDEGIEYFYRSFGGEQTPFFQVVKYRNRLYELLLKGRL